MAPALRWGLAGLAPALLAGILFTTGRAHPAILGYHGVCAAGIWLGRGRLRALFARPPSLGAWIVGTTVVFLAGLWAPALFWDPRSIRPSAMAALFPWRNVDLAFILFAAYTMILHCPLEEIFWRGVVLDPGGPPGPGSAANGVFFYLVHAAALAYTLGRLGWLLAIPAGIAGAAWSWVTRRSGSLWPALLSHAAVDLAILWGIWFFFVRGGVQA